MRKIRITYGVLGFLVALWVLYSYSSIKTWNAGSGGLRSVFTMASLLGIVFASLVIAEFLLKRDVKQLFKTSLVLFCSFPLMSIGVYILQSVFIETFNASLVREILTAFLSSGMLAYAIGILGFSVLINSKWLAPTVLLLNVLSLFAILLLWVLPANETPELVLYLPAGTAGTVFAWILGWSTGKAAALKSSEDNWFIRKIWSDPTDRVIPLLMIVLVSIIVATFLSTGWGLIREAVSIFSFVTFITFLAFAAFKYERTVAPGNKSQTGNRENVT